IRKLPAGHVLRWRNDQIVELRSYWRPEIVGTRQSSLDEAVEELMPLVHRAVTDCMVADVPVGCFLSGGIDSSVIAALMAETLRKQGGPALRTFTLAFR